MDIHEIRMRLKTKSIYDIPLRVTYYARVSSEKDEQLNSLDNQISYYKSFIAKNKNWEYVDGYIDEGLSGISTKKRENFHRMIDDAKAGLFDMVITKEITRFARNTLDSIQYTRELLSHGVGVFFQNDNINTFDEDSELRLTIMSGIAQDELRKLSSRVRFGHQEAIKKHVVLGNSRMFGYTKKDKRLVIDEKEAIMVRQLFELYATGQYSLKQIEKIFWERGYRNHNGKRILHTTLSNTIANPKYKGYYVGNKVKIVDMFTKKQKFLPPEEWVMFKDETGEIVPAIIDEELWEKANDILKRRSLDVKNRQNKCNHGNLLTGKLICTHCNRPYYRKDSRDTKGNIVSRWVCSGKISNGKDSCPSFIIYEEEIKEVIYEVFCSTQKDVDSFIKSYEALLESVQNGRSVEAEKEKCQKKLDALSAKKSKLLDYNIAGQISDADFLRMNKSISKEESDLLLQIEQLEAEIAAKERREDHFAEIKRILKAAGNMPDMSLIDVDFIETYIDKIFVTPLSPSHAKLEIKLCTGAGIERDLSHTGRNAARSAGAGGNCKGCTGQTFKKMIQAYEQSNLK